MTPRAVRFFAFASAFSTLPACMATTHAVTPSTLGTAHRSSDLLATIDEPGPLSIETINASDWTVDRSGLIDLSDPAAKAAGLKEGDEPIQIFVHVVRHPTKGTFLIDTGVERALRDAPGDSAVRGLVARVAHTDRLKVHVPLADWLATERTPLSGVFYTHLHFDHAAGTPDLPAATLLYTGPGESAARTFQNVFVQGTTDRMLAGKGPVQEWQFVPDADARFSVIDIFSDGSLWAIFVPGHTRGSTAYLARTVNGPVLLVGDTCHTKWGWDHNVPPGSFTADRDANRESLARLEQLVREHPKIDVRLGHQYLQPAAPVATH